MPLIILQRQIIWQALTFFRNVRFENYPWEIVTDTFVTAVKITVKRFTILIQMKH